MKSELPPRALIPKEMVHLLSFLLEKEIQEHEAYLAKGVEPVLSPSELEEYKQLIEDLDRLYETGAAVFELRSWPLLG